MPTGSVTEAPFLGSPEVRDGGQPTSSNVRPRGALLRWDALSLGIVAFVANAATLLAVSATSIGYTWLTPLFAAAAAILGAISLAGLVVLSRGDAVPIRALPQQLARTWREPPGDWIYFVLGVLLALPVTAFHTTVVAGDSDSVRVIASVLHVQEYGLGYLVETQETLLPHLILGPLLAAGGIPAVMLFSVVSVQVLAGVLCFLTWRFTRSALGAIGAVSHSRPSPRCSSALTWFRCIRRCSRSAFSGSTSLTVRSRRRPRVGDGSLRCWPGSPST